MSEQKNKSKGEKTKEFLIDCAGQIIAIKGFKDTTSKEICELAGENMAAINYHFGSREGLYREVLAHTYQTLIGRARGGQEDLENWTPRQRLENFINENIYKALVEKSWEVRVWAREIINPSPFLKEFLGMGTISNEFVRLNYEVGYFTQNLIMLKHISEYTGIPFEDKRLYSCALSFFGPFAMLIITQNNASDYNDVIPDIPMEYPMGDLIEAMLEFGFAGLDAFK